MADILASDIKFLAAERMTDLDDSGGYPTAVEVLDNVDNNLFPDIASGNRIAGAFQHRMIYGAVRSNNDAMFLASRVYVATPPTDTTVNPLIWAGQAADERPEALETLYSYADKGANTNFRLFTDYGPGATQIIVYWSLLHQSTPVYWMPDAGKSITVILEDTSAGSFQVVTLTYVSGGGTADYQTILYNVSPPLTQNFGGALFFDEDHENYVTPTQIYYTLGAAVAVYGIDSLDSGASIGDLSITVNAAEKPLAPVVSYINSATGGHLIVDANGYSYFAQTAVASAGRTQTLTIEGSYNRLMYVYYQVNGVWTLEWKGGVVGTGSFLTTLAKTPDTGSTLIYFTATSLYTYYTSGTKFVFLLQAPVEPSTVTVTALSTLSNVLTAADDGVGGFTGDVSAGAIDYATGLMTLTLDETCNVVGVAVDYQYTTLADDLPNLGIELARLPASKTASIFRLGEYVIVHHTQHQTLANPLVANTTYALNRSGVRQIWLEDAIGARIPTSQYTVDLSAGSIHTIVGLNLSGYQQPVEAYTTIHDEAVIVGLSNEGKTLQLSQALTYNYAADVSYVSSLLWIGDVFASITVPFSQQAWTSVWSNTVIGTPITPQFAHSVYPIVVTNDGAITERWRIQFTGTTTINIIGEHVGQIATSLSTTADIAPVNPYTSKPYFTIPTEGWGAGWVSGNLLRFNTTGADAAIHCARIAQPSASAVTDDQFKLIFLGDVDA